MVLQAPGKPLTLRSKSEVLSPHSVWAVCLSSLSFMVTQMVLGAQWKFLKGHALKHPALAFQMSTNRSAAGLVQLI